MDLTSLLSGWIEKIEKENPPPENISAINFGMLQSDKGFMVYVTGSEIYDANDDDWAGEIDYQPPRKDKYFLLPREITKGLKWQKVLEVVIVSLKQLSDSNPSRLLFNNRVATAGFDDGELTIIKAS
jgi:hypothetical protein